MRIKIRQLEHLQIHQVWFHSPLPMVLYIKSLVMIIKEIRFVFWQRMMKARLVISWLRPQD